MDTKIKRQLFKQFGATISVLGFVYDKGNYFRCDTEELKQAIYLQPSIHGDGYFPEMMITFSELNSKRMNKMDDCHLRSRLSSYFHPNGDSRHQQEWRLREDDISSIRAELAVDLTTFLASIKQWFDEYPDWQIAEIKMQNQKWARAVHRYELFLDLGKSVPTPTVD
jgi:Domain of unknown function (DUF4304)